MSQPSIFECGNCQNQFNDSIHKPLSLPCGHVYWESCLHNIASKEGIVWPSDNTRHRMLPKQLPVCYAILMNLPMNKSTDINWAKHKNKRVKFYCSTHEQFLCSDCVIEHSGAGHNVTSHTPNITAIRSEINDMQQGFVRKIGQAQEQKRNAVNTERQLTHFYEKQLSSINSAYDKSIQFLTNQRNALINKVKCIRDDSIKQIENTQLQSLKSIDSWNRVIQKIEKFGKENHVYDEMFHFINYLKSEGKKFDQINAARPPPKFYEFKEQTTINELGSMIKINAPQIKKPTHQENRNRPWLTERNHPLTLINEQGPMPMDRNLTPKTNLNLNLNLSLLAQPAQVKRERRANTSRHNAEQMGVAQAYYRSASNTVVKDENRAPFRATLGRGRRPSRRPSRKLNRSF